MARPRRIIAHHSYLVSRRVRDRAFRLRPTPLTNQIVRYCLGWAASRYGVLIHAVAVMSNHLHVVLTDPRRQLPNFTRELHRNIAKAMNASQRKREGLWSPERCSHVHLPTAEDVLEKIGYAAANPVAAGLVESPEQWPGVLHCQPGTSMVVERPAVYFDPKGSAPDFVRLEIVPLPGEGGDCDSWVDRVDQAIGAAVRRAVAAVRARGVKFLGSAGVMKKSLFERAKSYEKMFQLKPTLAAGDAAVRRACRKVERAFQTAYRLALDSWRGGDRTVEFPLGTWWMCVHHSAAVASALELASTSG